MAMDFSSIINPYMNYGSYGSFGGYGNYTGRYGNYSGLTSGIDYRSNTGSRVTKKDHTLRINDSDSVASKALKEAINRVNAAGNQPQNARGTTEKSKTSDGESQSRGDLNQAVRKMSADDIRSLFYMMSSAFGGYGGLF